MHRPSPSEKVDRRRPPAGTWRLVRQLATEPMGGLSPDISRVQLLPGGARYVFVAPLTRIDRTLCLDHWIKAVAS
jgi:hypothetical protein